MREPIVIGNATLHRGDCIEVMRGMPDNSVDSIVTDPPYELGFMGKSWDASGIANSVDMWREALRVLKPGGHLLAFSGSRTYHRMTVAIEDAGFEIRDQIMWVYGSGFPKSLDVSKAIDKQAGRIGENVIELKQRLIDLVEASGKTRAQVDAECGFRATNYLTLPAEGKRPDPWVACLPPQEKWARMREVLGAGAELNEVFARAEREVVGTKKAVPGVAFSSVGPTELDITAPATDAARQWSGWGTALKPAHEPICVARKPLAGTVAANVLQFGTGALNIDGCRVATTELAGERTPDLERMKDPNWRMTGGGTGSGATHESGRWPANLIHDGSAEVVALFPESTSGAMRAGTRRAAQDGPGSVCYGTYGGNATSTDISASTGSAARFFYCPKASRTDRNEGCEHMDKKPLNWSSGEQNPGSSQSEGADKTSQNNHPTVKPTDLMAYLCRLVTPPGGIVLDPFMGSGSTGKAAMREGFRFVGIDMTPEYVEIARARIAHEIESVANAAAEAKAAAEFAARQPDLFATTED